MLTKTIQIRCDKCGSERASQVVQTWMVETGYWGERPEEYGHYPGDGPWEERQRILKSECPDCIATIVSLSTAISEELFHLLKGEPDRLRHLSAQLFERLVAELLERMGFKVALVGRATMPDGGIDLIAVPKQITVGIPIIGAQIKHHYTQRKTGLEAVDRLLAWKGDPFQIGLLITNTDFTSAARWKAGQPQARHFIRLRTGKDIARWLAGEFASNEELKEIPDHVNLASGLVVPVPKPLYGSAIGLWPTNRKV
jgi:restriction endonuclease